MLVEHLLCSNSVTC